MAENERNRVRLLRFDLNEVKGDVLDVNSEVGEPVNAVERWR